MNTKQFIKAGLLAVMAVLASALFSAVWAEDATQPETMDVVASGVGMNETEATKDALANAVRQAIGAIVGTDTLIQNEEVVRDQILTYSDGFAENYELVGKPGTTLSGLTSVTIRARIVRSKLIQKAKAANIAVVEVDGKGMFAEAVTKIEQSKSATAMLAKEFQDMPKRLIKAEVVGKPAYNEKTKTIQVAVQASVDRAAYDALVARILPILDGIGTETFTVASSDVTINDYDDGLGTYVDRVNFPSSLFPESYLWNYQDRTQSSIVLCVRANGSFNSTQWKVYLVDESVLTQINSALRPVSLSVDVVGGDQTIMDSHYVSIGEIDRNDRRMQGGPITFDDHNSGRLFIYPGLAEAPKFAQWGNVSFCLEGPLSMKSTVDFDMPPEKLKDISQIVCKISSSGVTVKE